MEEKLQLYEELINRLYESDKWLEKNGYESWEEVKTNKDVAYQLRWNIIHRIKVMQRQIHKNLNMNETWNEWV